METSPGTTPPSGVPTPRWLGGLLAAAAWSLSAIVTVMAATGQVGFAHWAGLTGLIAYCVPAVTELLAVLFLLLGYQQGLALRSPYPLWALACVVGAFATYTNLVHAGPRAGLVFGAASAATLALWLIKLWLSLSHALVAAGKAAPGRPKLGALWGVAPRLATRAYLVSIRLGINDLDTVRSYAEMWIVVRDDTAAAQQERGASWLTRRKLAKRTAWRAVYSAAGRPVSALPTSVRIERVTVDDAPPAAPKVEARPDEPAPAPQPEARPTAPRRASRARQPRAQAPEVLYANYAGTLDRAGTELTAREIADAFLIHEGSARKVRIKLRQRYADEVASGARAPQGALPPEVAGIVAARQATRHLGGELRALGAPNERAS